MRRKLLFVLIAVFISCFTAFFCTACTSCGNDNDNEKPNPDETVVDETAPVITIDGQKQFTVKVGQELVLPSARAVDDVDGDISDGIVVIPANGSKFCSVRNGKFVSDVAGVHEILYCAVDKANNDAFESVYVTVTPAKEESKMAGENDLNALSVSGGVFYENFEKGPDSPLVKGMFKDYYTLLGDESVISGNSLVIDYKKVPKDKSNKIYFSNVMPFLTSGVWEVTFKIKLISGTPIDELYFAYSLNGDDSVTSYGKKCSLKGMHVGDTQEITYKSAIEIEQANAGKYLFYVYAYGQGRNDAVLAFDDFIFKRTDLPYLSVSPTLDELSGGVTFDWTKDKYLTLGILENVNEISDSSVKDKLTASEDFGDTAVRLYSSSRLCGISSLFDTKYFKSGRVYKLRIPYYIAEENSSYISVVNGTVNNRTVGWNIFNTVGKVGVAEIRFVTNAGEKEFIFYTPDNWENLYIGNITISLCEKNDEKVDGQLYSPTEEQLKAGYTFEMKKNYVPQLVSEYTDVEFYDLNKDMPDSAYEPDRTYFKGDYALRLGGYYGTRISAFDGFIKASNYYEVSMVVYAKNPLNAKQMHLLVLDANVNQLNVKGETFNVAKLADDVYKIQAVVKGELGGKFLSFYSENSYMMYVASVSLKIHETAPYTVLSIEDTEEGVGATIEFKNGGLILDGDTYNLKTEKVGVIDGYDLSGENAYLHIENENLQACALALKNYSGLFVKGQVYKFTVVFTDNSVIGDMVLLPVSAEGRQISGITYSLDKESGESFATYSVWFRATGNTDSIALFVPQNNAINAYIKTITLVKDNQAKAVAHFTEEDIGNVGDDGATIDFSKDMADLGGSYNVDAEYVQGEGENQNKTYLRLKASAMPTGIVLASYRNVFKAGKYYKLTIVMESAVTTSRFDVLFQGANGVKTQNPLSFDKKDLGGNRTEYSICFSATENLSYLELFDYNAEEFGSVKTELLIESINLKMIAEDDSDNNGKTPSQIDDESKWGEWR